MGFVQSSYIHYVYNNYDGPKVSNFPQQVIKEKIKNTFIQRFQQQQQRIKNVPPSQEQIISLLNDISENGVIGQPLIQFLNELNWEETWDESGVAKSGLRTGNKATFGLEEGAEEVDIPQAASNLAKKIEEALNQIVIVLDKCQQNVLIQEIQKAFAGTGIIIQRPNLNVQYKGMFSPEQLQLADVGQTESALQSIREALIDLGGVSTSTDLKSIYSNVTTGFNKLSGFLYEPVVVHAANLVKYETGTEFQKAHNELRGKGINVYSNIKAELITTNEEKPDIKMTCTRDGVTFEIGGSVKLSQTQDIIEGKDVKIKNIHSGYTLGRMFTQALNIAGLSTDILQWYEAGLGAMWFYGGGSMRWAANNILIGDKKTQLKIASQRATRFTKGNSSGAFQALESGWNDLKEFSKYAAVLDMLVGSGNKLDTSVISSDLASVLVVNNRVYSMWAILSQITEQFDKFVTIRGNGWSNSTFIGWHNKIVAQEREPAIWNGPDYAETRSENTKALIESLYNHKIEMTLKLAQMAPSL